MFPCETSSIQIQPVGPMIRDTKKSISKKKQRVRFGAHCHITISFSLNCESTIESTSGLKLQVKIWGYAVKLNGRDYRHHDQIDSQQLSDILSSKVIFDLVENGDANMVKMSLEYWKKMQKKTIGIIRHWVFISVFHHVNLYERKNTHNKFSAIRKLVNLKFK
ncbi:hypothetical protein Lal_00037796 [Lupinus albus]|nr:hypothetical protein Lal_00037796 [Lupinus albus]